MWLYTDQGAVSVVKNRNRDGELIVRSRDKETLEALCPQHYAMIITTTANDYPFRIFMSKEDWIECLTDYVDDMEYDNFKNHVKTTRPDILRPYYEVYNATLDLEPINARSSVVETRKV
jgi:hypothetical protein